VAPGAAAFAKRCASCHALGDYGGHFGPQLLEPIARELRALDAAMRERRVKAATLVTLNERGSESQGRRPVEIVAVWEWLLRPDD